MREKLLKILRVLGLYNTVKAIFNFFKRIVIKVAKKSKNKKFLNDFSEFTNKVKLLNVKSGCVVFVGILCTPRKPTLIPFLEQIKSQVENKDFVLLDESKDMEWEQPFKRLVLPRSFPSHYDRFLEVENSAEYDDLLNSKEYLNNALINITKRCANITLSYAKAIVCQTYYMYIKAFDILKPEAVVVWNEYSALHTVCVGVCKEKGIKTAYLEFGVIPGTFAFEYGGQMGRSLPARKWEEFYSKVVTEDEIASAGSILDFLLESRLNRNVQPQNEEETFKAHIKKNRPIILFAGQQDYDSGMVPYTEETKKFNSPCFESSLEAAYYLAEIAKKNDWNFIFKPHPNMAGQYKRKTMLENIIYVNRYDLNELIDMADVVITIVSQVAYVSLIRKCPVIMLGYNQLRGKKCTYEAFAKEKIEEELIRALDNGYTEEQKNNFVLHTAQLLKYYLFDNLAERSVRYGLTSKDINTKEGN